MNMRIVDFSEKYEELWRNFLHISDYSSFWQTRDYINFLIEINKSREVRELSFFIFDENSLVAVCPLFFDNYNNCNQFGIGLEPIPYPAILIDMGKKIKNKVFSIYMEEVKRRAEQYNVRSLLIRISPQIKNHNESYDFTCNPLVLNNFYDETYVTQIVDLTISENFLWKNIRKGHRSDITNAKKYCNVNIYGLNAISNNVFELYKALHINSSGKQTRSNYSYEIMLSWVRKGHAILLEACQGGASVAFVLVSLFGKGAYYGSSCIDNNIKEYNAAHLLQWEAILWLKKNNYLSYETGRQFFGPQWNYNPSIKDINISKFKRGFGGESYSVYCGRFFF